MSVDPSELSEQARRTRSASGDMFDSLGDLGDSIDREEDLIDDLESELEEPRNLLYDVLEQAERDYRRVEAFANNYSTRQEDLNERLENLVSSRSDHIGTTNPWNSWQQPWGMYQWQNPLGQHQQIGWMDQTQMYGQSQTQTSNAYSWFNNDDFWGSNSGSAMTDIEDGDDFESGLNEEDYEDGSVDMDDNFAPDTNFNYEATNETNGATQSFSFSGSGVNISGSVTMEQSVGDDHQYFEASF